MKKTLFVVTILLASVVFRVPAVTAQTGSMHALSEAEGMGNENALTQTQTEGDMQTESVEKVLQDILEQQNVSTVQELDLAKINDDEWERLGDAVMEVQHPGEAHGAMDKMMGGEGSESLRQMHINMGQAYLGYGCGNSFYGQGTMCGSQAGIGSMMGYGGFSNVHGLLAGATWTSLIIFLVAGTYFFIKQAGLPLPSQTGSQAGKK